MKKITTIILLFFIALTILGAFVLERIKPPENTSSDIEKITNKDIVDLLKTNPDSLEYITKYKDFKIQTIIPLTKESIVAGQNGENFKEVYQDLSLEDNRYLRADLMNAAGNWGLIAVLDLKTRSVLKAFGLMLMQAGVQTGK